MAPARTVDIQEFINPRPLSRYQIMVIVLCFFVVAADGFDTAAVGYIAPALRAQWGVTPAQLAPLFVPMLKCGSSPSNRRGITDRIEWPS